MARSWVETTLREVVHVQNGMVIRAKSFSSSPTDVRILRGLNISTDGIRWDDVVYLDPMSQHISDVFFLSPGDVCLAMDRPVSFTSRVTRVGQISTSDVPSVIINRNVRLRAKTSEVTEGYIYLVVQSLRFRDYLLNQQKGAPLPHISSRDLEGFPLAVPSVSEQLRIVDVIGMLDEHIINLVGSSFRDISVKGEVGRLIGVRKTLLEDLLAGRRQISREYDRLLGGVAS